MERFLSNHNSALSQHVEFCDFMWKTGNRFHSPVDVSWADWSVISDWAVFDQCPPAGRSDISVKSTWWSVTGRITAVLLWHNCSFYCKISFKGVAVDLLFHCCLIQSVRQGEGAGPLRPWLHPPALFMHLWWSTFSLNWSESLETSESE